VTFFFPEAFLLLFKRTVKELSIFPQLGPCPLTVSALLTENQSCQKIYVSPCFLHSKPLYRPQQPSHPFAHFITYLFYRH